MSLTNSSGIDRKAQIQVITNTSFTIPVRWVALTVSAGGGTVDLTDSDGNTMTLADGETFSYGDPMGSRGFNEWTIVAGSGVTARIVYNKG